jgi:hypothetical protein
MSGIPAANYDMHTIRCERNKAYHKVRAVVFLLPVGAPSLF